MTAQIPDTFIFQNDKYDLIGKEGGDLIFPEYFGMKSEMIHTACYRGFYATYEFADEALYLRELTINEKNQEYKPIGDIKPSKDEFDVTYHGLDVVIPFTGKIRLAKDLIEDLNIHMGYQKPTAYKKVLDFTLENGRVVEIYDLSNEMEKNRRSSKEDYKTEKITKMINDSFSLDIESE